MQPISYHARRVIDRVSFLSRFEDVKETHASKDGVRHQFEARCPAHDTSHRSLAIAWTYDDLPLVHCHAGCSPSEVLGAVGLSLSDIYPDGSIQERRKSSEKRGPIKPSRLNQVIDTYKRTGRVIDRSIWERWAKNMIDIARNNPEELSQEDKKLAYKVAEELARYQG